MVQIEKSTVYTVGILLRVFLKGAERGTIIVTI